MADSFPEETSRHGAIGTHRAIIIHGVIGIHEAIDTHGPIGTHVQLIRMGQLVPMVILT